VTAARVFVRERESLLENSARLAGVVVPNPLCEIMLFPRNVQVEIEVCSQVFYA
jgi:hypothetical protein